MAVAVMSPGQQQQGQGLNDFLKVLQGYQAVNGAIDSSGSNAKGADKSGDDAPTGVQVPADASKPSIYGAGGAIAGGAVGGPVGALVGGELAGKIGSSSQNNFQPVALPSQTGAMGRRLQSQMVTPTPYGGY